MRIAVFHNLPSGGAKRALYNFVRELGRGGHSLDLFIPSTADESFLSLKPLVGRTVVQPVRRSLGGLLYSCWKYVVPVRFSASDLDTAHRQLARAIDAGGYDIVYVDQDRYTMSPFVLKHLRTCSVYYCAQPSRQEETVVSQVAAQSSRPGSALRHPKKLWSAHLRRNLPRIDRENAQWSRCILTNSAFTRETIAHAYGQEALVSHLGVDPEVFRPLELPRENFVLSVGSMGPTKGYDFLIRSLALVDPRIRPRLVIVSNAGSSRYSEWIAALAKENGVVLEEKRLVSDDELVRLYNRAALFLYTPYREPFGLAAIEAMACGTPVVAVAEGGVRESVIDGATGLRTPRDEGAFARAIATLLADRPLQERLSARAYASVQNYWNVRQAGERLLQHMRNAISAAQTSRA